MLKWLIISIFVVSNYNTYISPLEQVKNLCDTALRSQSAIKASFISFFREVIIGVFAIRGRVNFLQLSRYSKSCEQRFRQNFHKDFDWIAFNRNLMDKPVGHRCAIAIDPSFISKSGKHTPGISYFWSGCAQAAKRGLEILGIALVDADTREAFAIRAVQTILEQKATDKHPECTKHIKQDTLVAHYLHALDTYKEQLHEMSRIIVADAFFSKSTFVQGLDSLGFELVSRFRDDVRLRYLYTGEQTGKRGRPKRFDGMVDLTKLRKGIFEKEVIVWDKQEVTVYSAVLYAVSLKRKVKAVIVNFEDDDKKTQTRKVFFSTDCTMSAKDVIDIYRSRFQIEFLFRDAKQFTGLTHCQARDEKALDFAFNLSLSAINVAKAVCRQQNINLSIADFKLLINNTIMVERFLSMFGQMPNINKNKRLKEHYVKELMLFGLKYSQ